jgi:hypothetical protein
MRSPTSKRKPINTRFIKILSQDEKKETIEINNEVFKKFDRIQRITSSLDKYTLKST